MKFNRSAASNTDSMSRSSLDLPPKAYRIAWCSLYGVEAVLIVIANLLTIILFALNKKLRKKSLLFVISMAFADLMFGTLLPLRIYFLGNRYQLWTARLYKPLRNFCDISQKIFLRVSLTSAALMSGERFYAIYWPLKHRTLTERAYYIVIAMVWVLTALFCTILFPRLRFTTLDAKHITHAFATYLLALLCIVCVCNIGIWRKFQRRSIAPQQQNRTAQNQRLTKTLLFVSFVAVLSWLPYILVKFLNLRSNVSPTTRYILQMALLLSYSNSFLNAVVYALRIPEFKQALGACFFRRQAVMINEGNERTAQRRTLSPGSSHSNLTHESEVMDTKL